MKKVISIITIVFALSMCFNTVSAQQKGQMGIGANLTIGTGDDFTNVGLGAKFQFTPINHLRFEPSFTYFFENDNISMWDLGLNAHYVFNLSDNFMVYPLVGVGMHGTKVFSESDSDFAVNAGAGAEYAFTSRLSGNFEIKYKKIEDWEDRTLFTFGLVYRL